MAKAKREPPPESNDDQSDDPQYRYDTIDKVRAVKPSWLLPDRIVRNALAILEGDQGCGKSTLLSALVASITTGRKWWSRPKQSPGNVLWLAGEEDPASAIRPRLDAMKADMSRVHLPAREADGSDSRIWIPGSVPRLRSAVETLALSLIIIDPLVCYTAADCDLTSEGGARAVVDPLNQLALETGCCVLITRHLRKNRTGPRLLHGMGSVAIGATARSILVIDYPDPRTERRIARPVKWSLCRRPPATEYYLQFTGEVPRVAELKDISQEADYETGDLADAGERDVRADARTLLRRMLAGGWVDTSAVIREAAAAGIGERTLRTAKAELGIRSRRVGTATPAHWEWGPPKEGWTA